MPKRVSFFLGVVQAGTGSNQGPNKGVGPFSVAVPYTPFCVLCRRHHIVLPARIWLWYRARTAGVLSPTQTNTYTHTHTPDQEAWASLRVVVVVAAAPSLLHIRNKFDPTSKLWGSARKNLSRAPFGHRLCTITKKVVIVHPTTPNWNAPYTSEKGNCSKKSKKWRLVCVCAPYIYRKLRGFFFLAATS
jgi:hypothetical protein